MKKLLPLLLSICALLYSQNPLTITKTAYEQFNCSFDFTAVVGSDGMTIDSVTAKDTNNNDVSGVIIASSPAPAITSMTDIVVFRVRGGKVGQTYSISVRVIDSADGSHYEGELLLKVTP